MVAEAAKLWLISCENAGLERSTLDAYRQRVMLHIIPLIGAVKLSQLSAPRVRAFQDVLRQDRSPAMVRQVVTALGAILADALDRGLVGQNVVRGRSRARRSTDQRKGKLKVGVDIPAPDEIRRFIARLDRRWRALLLTAIFTGLRASELRGLRWTDVDLKVGELQVRQRADRFSAIGRLKSAAGERTVPLPPMLVNALREHRVACPNGNLDLVFPNGAGNVENYRNIMKRGLIPAMVAAGIVDAAGKAKYTGLHALRHFYASWCINRRVDGGLELPLNYDAKILGQADRSITVDRDNMLAYVAKSFYLLVSLRPNDAFRAADAGLAIDLNSAPLLATRSIAETYLRQFERAKSDVQQAMRLSPRDPALSQWHNFLADAEIGLGNLNAAIEEANKAIDGGYRVFYAHLNLAAAHALKGDMDEATAALAEARRINPKLSIKWLTERKPVLQPAFDVLRKAGLPEE